MRERAVVAVSFALVSVTRSIMPQGRPVAAGVREPVGGSGREPSGVDALGPGPADVVRPAQLLEQPDEACARVDLALLHPVAGAGGVRVVQVVPRLAQRQ